MKMKKIAALVTAFVFVCTTAAFGTESTLNANWGDVNADGSLTAEDAAVMLQKVLNSSYKMPVEDTDNWMYAADVSGNGSLEADDAAIILQKVLNDDYKMPVELLTETTEETTETTTEETTEETTETTTEETTETTTEETTETTTEKTTETTTEETTETTTETTTEEITETTTIHAPDYAYSYVVDENMSVDDVITSGSILYSNDAAVIYASQDISCSTEKNAVSFGSNAYVRYMRADKNDNNMTASVNGLTSAKYRNVFAVEAIKDCVVAVDCRVNSGKYVYIAYGDPSQGLTSVASVESPIASKYGTMLFEAKAGTTYYFLAQMTTPYIYAINIEDSDAPATTESTTEATTIPGDYSDGVVATDFKTLKSALTGTDTKIYVMGEIDCISQLTLSTSNANIEIVGVTNTDGTGAVLNFASFRDSAVSSGSGGTGIKVTGSGYTFKNLIVENAPDCGMRITGSNAGNCVIENCVFRYNNNSGVSVTEGGSNNTFRYVDSYRNGDIVQSLGADADGFSVKLAAGGGNSFYNCRAWENSDDGWDSYDRGDAIPDVSYEECLAWHNGDPNIFTGEYDYENGFALDKNLLYVQAILESDSDFETEYNNGTVEQWPNVDVSLYSTSVDYDDIHGSGWDGNPNGFKFGSAGTPSTSYRYIKNCIAFDHVGNQHQTEAKGFDQNNGSAHFDLENALSFNNVKNYQMVKMTADSVSGVVYSFNGSSSDEMCSGMAVTSVDEQTRTEIINTVYEYRDALYDMVYNDVIPGEFICSVFE